MIRRLPSIVSSINHGRPQPISSGCVSQGLAFCMLTPYSEENTNYLFKTFKGDSVREVCLACLLCWHTRVRVRVIGFLGNFFPPRWVFSRDFVLRGIKNPRGKRPGVISGPPSPAWPLPPSPPTPPKHPNFPCFPMLPPSPIPRRDETLPRRGLEILKTHTFAQPLQKESPPYLFFSKSYSTFKTKLSQKTPSESSLFVHNFFSARPIGLKF